MPLDVLLALGIVLVVTLTAFAVSAALGLVVGRLGLDEPDESRVAQPAPPGRRSRG